MTTPTTPTTPISLRIVAASFILSGLWAIWALISGLFSGSLVVGSGILCLFIGIGLLRRRPLWRDIALVLLALGVIFVTILGAFAVFGEAVPVQWFDTQLFGAERRVGAALLTAFLLLIYGGQIWMLTKANVKAVFKSDRAGITPAGDDTPVASN